MRIISFGYLHGPPPPAHLTLDLRDLFRDPHVDPAMRELTGLDQAVIDNVMKQPGAERFVRDLVVIVTGLSIVHSDVTVAIGCAGGRHRSVVLAYHLATWLVWNGSPEAHLSHRDVDKPVVRRGSHGDAS